MPGSADSTLRGYLSPAYRDSFRPFGEVLTLPGSGLHVLKRPLPDGHHDLVGLYPFSRCPSWAGLAGDLDSLRGSGAVALSLVSDPFRKDEAVAAMSGWAVCRPFKAHWVVDLTGDWRAGRSRKTRYYAAKGCAAQEVFVSDDPAGFAKEFWTLYAETADRLDMGPLQRFTPGIVAAHLALPDVLLVIARTAEGPTGAMIAIENAQNAYIHLIGTTARAARLHTGAAMYHVALERLEARGCRMVSLGGGAGLANDPEDGLYRFKKRWATEARTTYLGGAVLDPDAYAALSAASGCAAGDFFPAYRAPGGPLAWTPPGWTPPVRQRP